MRDREKALEALEERQADALGEEVRELFAGRPAVVLGSVIAQLLGEYLDHCPDADREAELAQFVGTVWKRKG